MVLALRQWGTSTSFLQVLELVFFSSDLEGLRKQFFLGGGSHSAIKQTSGESKGTVCFPQLAHRKYGNRKKTGGRRQRKRSGRARQKRKEGKKEDCQEGDGERRWRPASSPDCTLYYVGKMIGSACSPPTSIPPPALLAPISASVSLSASHTLLRFPRGPDPTAGLIKQREAERQKKEAEGKRGHTTGRHQLKPCLLTSFFPFISHFMIEFLTNMLAVHWVQAHSKKLLFNLTSFRML